MEIAVHQCDSIKVTLLDEEERGTRCTWIRNPLGSINFQVNNLCLFYSEDRHGN